MKVSAIQNQQNYNHSVRRIKSNNIGNLYSESLSFKNLKGAAFGAISGAMFGALVLICNNSLTTINMGLSALLTGSYSFIGSLLGDALTGNDDDDKPNKNAM